MREVRVQDTGLEIVTLKMVAEIVNLVRFAERGKKRRGELWQGPHL